MVGMLMRSRGFVVYMLSLMIHDFFVIVGVIWIFLFMVGLVFMFGFVFMFGLVFIFGLVFVFGLVLKTGRR